MCFAPAAAQRRRSRRQEDDAVRIAEWMKHPVHTVKPLDSVAHARQLLEEHRINQLPVVVNGRLVGIVTDRDLRDAFPSVFDAPLLGGPAPGKVRAAARPEAITVEEVMTREPVALTPADTVETAARLMRRQRIGAVPVVDGERLVGILARSDVLEAFVALAERSGDAATLAPAPASPPPAHPARPADRRRS
jgi:acetoin utilization protein AcuB